MSTPTVSAFSSLDAHNGCRALFNGSKGWAYIGPTGSIDPADYPGTVSYDYGAGKTPRGGGGNAPGQAQGQGHAAAARSATTAPSRPGEGVGRKTNDVRSAYLDAADLEYLLHEVERCAAADAADAATAGLAGGRGDGVVVEGEQRDAQPRRGRPIVLTLQAILAATSPPPTVAPSASESHSESGPESDSNSVCGTDSAAGCVVDTAVAAEAEKAVATRKSVGFSGASDLTHFPPLALLSGCFPSKQGGLFLAPPITMMRGGGAGEDGGEDGGSGRGGGAGGGGLTRGVSCSEAVAATSIAEAAQVSGGGGGGGGGGGAMGGLSRVGWWLRWATNGAEAGQDAGRASGSTATGSAAQSDDNGTGNGTGNSTENGAEIASYETRTGVDGWQVVSCGEPPAEQAMGGAEPAQGSAGANPPPATATATATTAAAAMAGGAWALVTGDWTGTIGNPIEGVAEQDGEGGGGGGEDDAASWCDCTSDDGVCQAEEADDDVCRALPECPVAVSDSGGGGGGRGGGGRGGGGEGSEGGRVLAGAAVTIEVALQCAVNSPMWDIDNAADNDSEHVADSGSGSGSAVEPQQQQQRQQQQRGVHPPTPPSPQLSPERLEAPTKKAAPISFRDMLMAPSSTGAVGFSRSQAFRDRVAAAAVAGGGVGGGGRIPPRSWGCSAPTLVDGGGNGGGAVYLWRKAAAGQGGKAADEKRGGEDEDPYYARKRVGAFAYKTKPRGKAHK